MSDFCDPMDYSLSGSSVHGTSQARIMEWVAISFSRESPDPGIERVSPALAGRFFTNEPPGNPSKRWQEPIIKAQERTVFWFFFCFVLFCLWHLFVFLGEISEQFFYSKVWLLSYYLVWLFFSPIKQSAS